MSQIKDHHDIEVIRNQWLFIGFPIVLFRFQFLCIVSVFRIF